MPRVLWTFLKVLVGLIVLAAAGGWYVWHSPDRRYAAYEMVLHQRFHQYDATIQEAAKKRGMDPMLIKAVIWRESRFRPGKVGVDGERGLMQITDEAARDWVKGEKVANFVPTDLFDPKVNIEAGSWLLARALHRYEGKDDPVPFALAEYNAGRSRVAKWAGERDTSDPNNRTSSQELIAKIDIPGTKSYIETVQERVHYYHQRGEL